MISWRSDSCRNLFSSLGGFRSCALMSTIRLTSGMFLSTSRSRIRDLEQCAAKEPDQSVSLTGIRQTSLKIVLTFLPGLRPTFR